MNGLYDVRREKTESKFLSALFVLVLNFYSHGSLFEILNLITGISSSAGSAMREANGQGKKSG